MWLSWRVRYFDKVDRKFKDRDLYLDTETLDPSTRANVELVMELYSPSSMHWNILKYRHLFQEEKGSPTPSHLRMSFSLFTLPNYFEDETGKQITLQEIGPFRTGDPATVVIPPGAKQHDINLMLAEKKPLPVAEVSLAPEEIRLLGYFTRDLQELDDSTFMKNGSSCSIEGLPNNPILKTAVTDDEIRSFVTIFRRLYMVGEVANFLKTTQIFVRVVGDHPKAVWVNDVACEYTSHLDSTPDFRPILQLETGACNVKRLIDVFLYTQYAHQPDERRQRQFEECLSQVDDKQDILTCGFLREIWKCSAIVINAGRVIAKWFDRYCDQHGVTPDILGSLCHDHPGLGAMEKEDDRRTRRFQEKAEELAMELWEQHGRPEGGASQFFDMAREQINNAFEGGGH